MRKQASGGGKFDYDRELEGIRALGSLYVSNPGWSNQARALRKTSPTHACFAGVAHEVVEAYGDDIMAHPVGTGPFRLVQWNRSSRIVLERSPSFRVEFFEASAAADDTRASRYSRA